ncbi:response regulator transcription factor [Microvirga pakistanensis]|uniref:response regulator transcription factor n=1 Tax=Microvirga pakistanensis TaxID=1682650 RepID=UPI00106C5221|nr:response regulator transcription factor [Microvirga pakistanensis]
MSYEAARPIANNNVRSVNTVLISKNGLICTGIKRLLDRSSYSIVSAIPDMAALSNHCPDAETDLFIIDGDRPVEQTIAAATHARATYPMSRIVVIASQFDLDFVRRGHAAGVNGFCLSGSSRDVLITSLELVTLGEGVLPPVVMTSLLNRPEPDPAPKPLLDGRIRAGMRADDPKATKLSAREAEVLRHLMGGAANKVIARELDVAEVTVKVHVKTILRKIGAANRTQAAMWASVNLPANSGSSDSLGPHYLR